MFKKRKKNKKLNRINQSQSMHFDKEVYTNRDFKFVHEKKLITDVKPKNNFID